LFQACCITLFFIFFINLGFLTPTWDFLEHNFGTSRKPEWKHWQWRSWKLFSFRQQTLGPRCKWRSSECMVGVYHILSRLAGLGSIVRYPSGVWSGAPETLFGHFVRNSELFYVCFSALWKLAVMSTWSLLDVQTNRCSKQWRERIITPKVGLQETITAVGKVTLHVWSSNWGQRPRKI